MTEEQMILLRDHKESAIEALKRNITEEQRERLTKLLPAIDNEIKHADEIPYSKLMHDSMWEGCDPFPQTEREGE